jgi:alpha-tubulin suppressor-like RCC1 family protein
VDANGALLACGEEEEGEGEQGLLGLRKGTSQDPCSAVVPTPVPSLAGTPICSVVCGQSCNLALSEAGQVFAWGCQWNEYSVLGFADNLIWSKRHAFVPTVMEELRNHRVRQVTAGYNHCAAVTEDGTLFTWETFRFGETLTSKPRPELGYGSFVHDIGAPYCVFGLEGIRIASVAVGPHFRVAVTEAGAVYSFGEGDRRLGHGDNNRDDVFLPERIEALDGIHVVAVAAGAHHALALTRCGKVYWWGRDDVNSIFEDDSDGGNDSDDRGNHVYLPQLITALLGQHV